MSNNKKKPSREGSKQLLNLSVLQRQDKYIVDVTHAARHTALYTYVDDTQKWERKGIEGSLFLTTRSVEPIYQVVVLNRLSTSNWFEPINAAFQIEEADPFLLFSNDKEEITGIWFHNKMEQEKISNAIKNVMKIVNKESASKEEAPSREDAAAQKKPKQKSEPKQIKIQTDENTLYKQPKPQKKGISLTPTSTRSANPTPPRASSRATPPPRATSAPVLSNGWLSNPQNLPGVFNPNFPPGIPNFPFGHPHMMQPGMPPRQGEYSGFMTPDMFLKQAAKMPNYNNMNNIPLKQPQCNPNNSMYDILPLNTQHTPHSITPNKNPTPNIVATPTANSTPSSSNNTNSNARKTDANHNNESNGTSKPDQVNNRNYESFNNSNGNANTQMLTKPQLKQLLQSLVQDDKFIDLVYNACIKQVQQK